MVLPFLLHDVATLDELLGLADASGLGLPLDRSSALGALGVRLRGLGHQDEPGRIALT